MTKVPATTTPEDYFRYICTDALAKEMFERYIKFVEENLEDATLLHEKICGRDDEIDDLQNQIHTLESEIDDLEDCIKILEKKLGESK